MATRKDRQRKSRQGLEMARKNKTKTSPILKWIGGAITLLGGIVSALTLLPRITVEHSAPIDKNDIFSSSFTITNNNFVPLEHVTAGVSIRSADFGTFKIERGQRPANGAPFGLPLMKPEWIDHTLTMDEKFEITIGDMLAPSFGEKLIAADVEITVQYQPWILPFHRYRVRRFKAHKESDGTFTWFSSPLDN
jgi:hypothetical protein